MKEGMSDLGYKARNVLCAIGNVVTHSVGINGAKNLWQECVKDHYPYNTGLTRERREWKHSGEEIPRTAKAALLIDRMQHAIGGALEEISLPQSSRELRFTIDDLDQETERRGISAQGLLQEIEGKGWLEIGTTCGAIAVAVIGVLANNPEMVTGAALFFGLRNVAAQTGWEIYHFWQNEQGR